MADRISLASANWRFAGFYGEEWRWREAYKKGTGAKGWLPATVPGSVHWDLLQAGEIPDPYLDRNSRHTEWVHQRTWVYTREFAVPADWDGRRIFLQFDGLDYRAEIYLDGELLGKHESVFRPALFELTKLVKPGQSHYLAVALLEAPKEYPQIGYTSKVHTVKGRFGYWWDFATRLVHLGIWQDVTLFATGSLRIADVWVRTALNADLSMADVTVLTQLDSKMAGATLTVEILDGAGLPVTRAEATQLIGLVPLVLTVKHPFLWWPNGEGGQPLYKCVVTVTDADGRQVSDRREVTFGFRRLTLEPNPWPPAGVEPKGETPLPYTFTVNDRRIFIKGWNWVPIDLMYGRGDLAERYEQLIRLAKTAGVNLLRVWGGGVIEKELFYDLCDQAGIMVWQEFIQSSSGLDNVPPSDPTWLNMLDTEAAGIIPLRRNHAALAVWCGGNELTDWEKRPASTREPALALLERKVAELDPDRFFLPTSPSGPSFGCDDDAGLVRPALMHDVHGPWHYRGPVESYLPYNHSTALFHSEFGTQGAVAESSLNRFMSGEQQWPPNDTNPNWFHHGSWFFQQHRVKELFGEGVETIREYLPLSQFLQAENLRYGVESNRRRWPNCSGAVIWQLNEPWPNGHNTSSVDYYLRPKMAYYYVKKAFAPVAASLRYESTVTTDGRLATQIFVAASKKFDGTVTATISDVSGKVWHEEERPATIRGGGAVPGNGKVTGGVAGLGDFVWQFPEDGPAVVICTLTVKSRAGKVLHTNPYLFSREATPSFASLRQVEETTLQVERQGHRLVITNTGSVYALYSAIDLDDARYHWQVDDNYLLLAPGESAAVTLTLMPRTERADTDHPQGRPAVGPLQVKVAGWNTRTAILNWEV